MAAQPDIYMKTAGVCDVTTHVITAADVGGSRQRACPSAAVLHHRVTVDADGPAFAAKTEF